MPAQRLRGLYTVCRPRADPLPHARSSDRGRVQRLLRHPCPWFPEAVRPGRLQGMRAVLRLAVATAAASSSALSAAALALAALALAATALTPAAPAAAVSLAASPAALTLTAPAAAACAAPAWVHLRSSEWRELAKCGVSWRLHGAGWHRDPGQGSPDVMGRLR